MSTFTPRNRVEANSWMRIFFGAVFVADRAYDSQDWCIMPEHMVSGDWELLARVLPERYENYMTTGGRYASPGTEWSLIPRRPTVGYAPLAPKRKIQRLNVVEALPLP